MKKEKPKKDSRELIEVLSVMQTACDLLKKAIEKDTEPKQGNPRKKACSIVRK